MSLWGKTDNLAGTPKFVTRIAYFAASGVDTTAETINILESNTGFATGDAVVYSINGGTVIGGLTDATTYYVRSVAAGLIELYDSYANAIAAPATTGRVDITGAGVGVHTLRRTGAANPFGDSNYNGQAILFVDREEAQVVANRAKGLVSPGWWVYRTYTDNGGATRHKAELLVAIDVIRGDSGDASDDAVVPDLTLTITTQPGNETADVGDDALFTVEATTNGNQPITYQWQVSTDDGVTWTDVEGATQDSLTVPEVTAEQDGDQYRVLVTTSTITVESDAGTLTVTA